MIIRDFFPGEAVRDFVQCYRIIHFAFDQAQPLPFKAYPPKPESCLHFFLRDSFSISKAQAVAAEQPPVLFSGQQTAIVHQYNGHDFIDVQVVFQPAAVYRLTGIPATHLMDQHLDATILFGSGIRYILEQLQQAPSYRDMLLILEDYLKSGCASRYKETSRIAEVANSMLQLPTTATVDLLARNACYSTKQFERKFNEQVGVPPKLYSRIIRFTKAFNLRNRFPQRAWTTIALQCGYTDYQHLARDYKTFTGLTPPAFHLLEDMAPENVLGLAKPLYFSRYRAQS